MVDVDTGLFLWMNASGAAPAWVVPLARFASTELPPWMMAGTVGAFLVGTAQVRRVVLRVLLAMAIAWVLARIGQHFLPMPRPFVLGLGTAWLAHGDSPGFPSTHASVAFAFAAVLVATVRSWPLRLVAVGLAALVSWSRICLGLHFPIDVLAGALVGVAGAWLSGLRPGALQRTGVAHE